MKMRSKFRSYFQNIVDMIHSDKNEIKQFIEKSLKTNGKNKISKNKTLKKYSYRIK